MEQVFLKWQARHDEAVEKIKKYLKPSEHHSVQMHELVEFMLCSGINPYGYLPIDWASAVNTATGFVSLLDYIHHALYDDGDIAFVTVNNEPRIVFANKYDDNFKTVAITANDITLAERRACMKTDTSIDVVVLDITPSEFCKLREQYEVTLMKRGFAFDAARHGVEFAVKIASKSKLYNPAWIEELSEKIKNYRKVLMLE